MGDGPVPLGIPGGALHAGAGFLRVKVGSTVDKLHTPYSPAAALGGMLAWHHNLTTTLPSVPVPQDELKPLGSSETA